MLQLPSTLQPGVTIVISPLLSLIQDQIITLNLKFAIPATFLNSQQTASQAAAVVQELRQGTLFSPFLLCIANLFLFLFSIYLVNPVYFLGGFLRSTTKTISWTGQMNQKLAPAPTPTPTPSPPKERKKKKDK